MKKPPCSQCQGLGEYDVADLAHGVKRVPCSACHGARGQLRGPAQSYRNLQAEVERLRGVERAAKIVHEQSVKDGGHGQTLAFEDALRGLEAALFGPADCASDPAVVPLPDGLYLTNGGSHCDVLVGPCACGATHTREERMVQQAEACTREDLKGVQAALDEQAADSSRTEKKP